MYRVINKFKDTNDNNYYYKEGKPYPREGYKPSKKRVEELTNKHPVYKYAFIEEVKEEKKTSKKSKE